MILDFDAETEAAAQASAAPFDVCIAGAGIAGITMAKTLADNGRRVILLEAGGVEHTDESQAVYQGSNVGRAYMDLDLPRLRFLGGTSNHWNGSCRPLDDWDFVPHGHIEHSGWPIGKRDLDPYIPEAQDFLDLGELPDDVVSKGSGGDIKEIFSVQSAPTRYNEKYFDYLNASDQIVTLVNANLVDIAIDPDFGRISGFVIQGYGEAASRRTIRADQYVLALGGIENARLLLNCNKQIAAGVGNQNDLVGRYFMEHPHLDIGFYVVAADAPAFRQRVSQDDFLTFAPTPQLKQSAQIASCRVDLFSLEEVYHDSMAGRAKQAVKQFLCSQEVIEDFAKSLYKFDCPLPVGGGTARVISEQVPNPSSRVLLDDAVDRFGLRRTKLDWRILPIDTRTVRETVFAFAKAFANDGYGRVKLFDWLLDEDRELPEGEVIAQRGVVGHHIGATRMAASPTKGVVDANCRVFGHDNLFIAGSSVFTTGGHTNPTYAIVQLALRLAYHLADLQRA